MKVSKHSLFAMEICLTGSNTRRNETRLTRTNQSDGPRDVCVCVWRMESVLQASGALHTNATTNTSWRAEPVH